MMVNAREARERGPQWRHPTSGRGGDLSWGAMARFGERAERLVLGKCGNEGNGLLTGGPLRCAG
jgi:hypothetical protein